MTTRRTRQRDALRRAFIDADRPLSPDEALARARNHYPGLGMATVYRNVKAFLEDRWLVPVDIPGMSPRYEVSGKEHHHHFHCKNCGRLYELEGCTDIVPVRLPRGFRATGHEFFLYGRCAACSR